MSQCHGVMCDGLVDGTGTVEDLMEGHFGEGWDWQGWGLNKRKADEMRGIRAGDGEWLGLSSAPKQGQRTHCGLAQGALVLPPPPLPTSLKAQPLTT